MVVEGIEKRIGEENPVEALGVQVRRHEGAVGEAGFDVELVEDAVEVCLSAGGLGGFFGIIYLFGIIVVEIVFSIPLLHAALHTSFFTSILPSTIRRSC